jgi:hypothetical protein
MAEAGGPADVEVYSFVVLVAPKGVPAVVRARLKVDVAKAVAEAKSKVHEALAQPENISLD